MATFVVPAPFNGNNIKENRLTDEQQLHGKTTSVCTTVERRRYMWTTGLSPSDRSFCAYARVPCGGAVVSSMFWIKAEGG
eukprot:COSAG02_NODE_4091_length_5797_cov_127.687434_6_plen_80_part_00